MPNPNPHTDFVLPGWATTPFSRHTCHLSLASAYSRRWNPRNLEYPWYEPWAQILQGLVADLPALAVAPQSYLWFYRHPKPGDHLIEPPARDEDDAMLDSVESIRVGSRRNKFQLVDFAVTRKVLRFRPVPVHPAVPPVHVPQAHDQFHLSQNVEYMGIPVLCELKRGPPRTSDFRTSLEHAIGQLGIASDQLIRQAHHLFEMYQHQEEVLLIAAAGFWFSYCILSREESKAATTDEVEAAEREEVDAAPDWDELPADTENREVDAVAGPGATQDSDELNSIYHGLENIDFQDQLFDGPKLHLMDGTNFRLCTNDWSRPLLFGTPPSNQVLYLIHQRLETIVNGAKG